MINIEKIFLITLALIGVLLVLLSMYVIPYIEKYKGVELPAFLIGVFIILVSLFLIKNFNKS